MPPLVGRGEKKVLLRGGGEEENRYNCGDKEGNLP